MPSVSVSSMAGHRGIEGSAPGGALSAGMVRSVSQGRECAVPQILCTAYIDVRLTLYVRRTQVKSSPRLSRSRYPLTRPGSLLGIDSATPSRSRYPLTRPGSLFGIDSATPSRSRYPLTTQGSPTGIDPISRRGVTRTGRQFFGSAAEAVAFCVTVPDVATPPDVPTESGVPG